MGHQPIGNNDDLTIEITMRHKDKQFPGVYCLKKEKLSESVIMWLN